jgi:hypothetical protein
MILHKKTISDRLAAAERWFASLFLTELLFITCIFSGTFSNATFNTVRDGIHDSSLEFSSGLAISIEKYTGVKVYGDSIQPQYPSTIYSDVIAGLSDTFTFFYMDTTDDVYKRDIRIVNGVSTSISSWKG